MNEVKNRKYCINETCRARDFLVHRSDESVKVLSHQKLPEQAALLEIIY